MSEHDVQEAWHWLAEYWPWPALLAAWLLGYALGRVTEKHERAS